jgi:beta-lactamase class C
LIQGVLGILVVSAGIHCSQPSSEIQAPVKTLTALDSFILEYSDNFSHQMAICNCPGAALAIVKDTVVTWVQGYGVADLSTGQKTDGETVFRLASVSKGFAALLAAKFVECGLLKWEDPVIKYIPDFALNPQTETPKITVSQVLSHSLGLPYHSYTNLVEEGYSLSNIIPLFKTVPLNLIPGQRYAYQNAAFAMIETILEQASGGTAFTNLLETELVQPLNLKHLSFTYEAMVNDTHAAAPHKRDDMNHYLQSSLTTKYYNVVSAGGINASASDMAIYLKLLMGQYPEVIGKQALDSMFAPRINTEHHRREYNYWPGVIQSYYGLGWRILDLGDHHRYYHGGYANEFRAEIAIDPSYKIGICGLFNAPCPLSDSLVPSFFEQYEQWMARKDSTSITISKR